MHSEGPDLYVVHEHRADVYEKMGRPLEALRDARAVIDHAPQIWKGYARSARLLRDMRKYDDALKMVDLALERVKADDTQVRVELDHLQKEILDSLNQLEKRSETSKLSESLPEFCYIWSLPAEIVAGIFTVAVNADVASPTVLSHVCRQWRFIALHTQSLWRKLRFTVYTPIQKLEVWLQRSAGHIREFRWYRAYRCGVAPSTPASLDLLPWEQIKICWLDQECAEELKDYLSDRGHIRASSNSRFRVEHLVVTKFNNRPAEIACCGPIVGPELRSLTLMNLRLQWGVIRSCSELSSLVIRTGFDICDNSLTTAANHFVPHDVFDLSRTSLLQKLVIHGFQPIHPNYIVDAHLNHLIHLDLGGQAALEAGSWLSHVTMPNLRELRISHILYLAPGLIRSFIPKANFLTTLRVQHCGMLAAEFFELLENCERLHTLELSHVTFQANDIIEKLAPLPLPPLDQQLHLAAPFIASPRTRSACSSLSNLILSHSPDIQPTPLTRLIRSRRDTSMRIASLAVDGCPQIDADSLAWLKQNISTVNQSV